MPDGSLKWDVRCNTIVVFAPGVPCPRDPRSLFAAPLSLRAASLLSLSFSLWSVRSLYRFLVHSSASARLRERIVRLRAKLFNYCQRTLLTASSLSSPPPRFSLQEGGEWNAKRERRGDEGRREKERRGRRSAGKKGRLSLVTLVLVQRRIMASPPAKVRG